MRAETAAGTSRSRATMPAWSLMVLALLFVGPVLMFETVFGGYQGAIAAASGVVVGLTVAWASAKW